MYAVLDIETTGGKYNEEGITEIAIYKFDGHQIVDQFISLINPEREIQAFVVNLTGINNNMLRSAPKFYEVAKRIVEITEDCIIVAHNALFDYRVLRTEFTRLGFEFHRETLCTVELSQKLIPGKESYSLGKLVRSLGIPVSDRHRANGDALATLELFKLLLSKDLEKQIITNAVKTDLLQKIPSKLLDIINSLPTSTGVYYLHKEDGDIVYIGRSKNIQRSVNHHFTSEKQKSKKIRKIVAAITYEETGSELIAQLKEDQEIKHNKPSLNRSRKRISFHLALDAFTDNDGFIHLNIKKVKAAKNPLITFSNIYDARKTLFRMAKEFNLCLKFLGLSDLEEACSTYNDNDCDGACLKAETAETYNQKVHDAVGQYSYTNKNMIIVDKGRTVDERSAILIENGIFKGVSFYNLNYQINNIDILKNKITPMQDNRDIKHLIELYLRKKKVIKLIEF